MDAALDLNMGMKTKGDSIEKDKKDIASFLLHIAVTVAAKRPMRPCQVAFRRRCGGHP